MMKFFRKIVFFALFVCLFIDCDKAFREFQRTLPEKKEAFWSSVESATEDTLKEVYEKAEKNRPSDTQPHAAGSTF